MNSGEELPGIPPAPTPAAPTGEKDALGHVFDPAKHRPEKDRIGRWKHVNRGGRKPRAGVSGQAEATGAASQPAAADFSDIERIARGASAGAAPANAVVIDDNATADTIIGVIQTALVLIGDDEGVLTDTEKTLLRAPLVRVLRKYEIGADVMPAEVDLALALAGVLIARLQKPKTATWFAKAKAWAINLWFRGKGELLRRDVRDAVKMPPTPRANVSTEAP